jgi:hypothetical protein
MLLRYEGDPAIYLPGSSCVIAGQTFSPCSSTANTNQRRILRLQNPDIGRYFGNIVVADDGATRTYNALVIQLQRRRAKGVTVQGNYTWSHCIDDGYYDIIQTNGGNIQSRRGANRGNCDSDRRHNFNMSTVYETPRFANRAVRVLGSGWQISGIVRALSGPYLSVATGQDIALTGASTGGIPGTDQRPNQVLPDPYVANRGANGWLNPAAFQQPAAGTYGNTGARNIVGPGSIRIDMGLTRTFAIREKQSLQLRGEAFNVPNHVNYCAPAFQGIVPAITCPEINRNSPNFGKILSAGGPRIMQLALKYVF